MVRILILSECLVFVTFILSFNLMRQIRGGKLVGKCPIHPFYFAVGKLTMGTSFAVLPVQAARDQLGDLLIPEALQYIAAVLLSLGIAFAFSAFLHLRNESRFGLSTETNGLKTTGIYQISRNPMYVGFYLATLASLVAVPHPVNIGCGLVGIYIHHRVILAEEQFLADQYGASYDAYRHRVRRYL
ncbi:MAG: isoprenylcysteine carboxylmethyltransferase family protein [Anaerolineae bacterium]|nr:isoprenylcysteine carboxylmethyltransferase family protein [Anaerolineae bacterium]